MTAPQRVEPVPPIPRPAAVRTLDLAAAPSAMDARWAKNAETVAARAVLERGEGMVACKCHPEGFVPSWFGSDCIEAACPLRGVAA
ncbi:MAG: hypothetical protein VYD90_10345 [Pseudomonadota bacterium]|nr:hypothetical protein [Pseudomonadota bacterium]